MIQEVFPPFYIENSKNELNRASKILEINRNQFCKFKGNTKDIFILGTFSSISLFSPLLFYFSRKKKDFSNFWVIMRSN